MSYTHHTEEEMIRIALERIADTLDDYIDLILVERSSMLKAGDLDGATAQTIKRIDIERTGRSYYE